MSLTSDDLEYVAFAKKRAHLYPCNTGNPSTDEYFKRTTLHLFALKIMDELREVALRCIDLSYDVKQKGTLHFLRYGGGRRMLQMWYAYRNLIFTADLHRTVPLNSDESGRLTQDLNAIYINLCGAIDNFAWALLHEFAPEKITLPPVKVGLFLPAITGDPRFAKLAAQIQSRSDWNLSVRTRRNPAAHQIPLTVPPQIVTSAEGEEYRKLLSKHAELVTAMKFDEANQIMQRLERIGRFVPHFVHDPELGSIPIYPTVPDDVGNLIGVFAAVRDFFSAGASRV